MEDSDNKNGHDRDEIYSNVVRAGKRTYFFDVRATKGNDYYLTITESKRKYDDDGNFHYQKHKIFLYKEDFEKFTTAMSESIRKVVELKNDNNDDLADKIDNQFTDVNFDDLGSNHNE